MTYIDLTALRSPADNATQHENLSISLTWISPAA